jgi:pullulanase/glycogen debranching enzyme
MLTHRRLRNHYQIIFENLQYATTMDIKNPPPYQQNVPVYTPQQVMVPTVQYAVQPVPQKDPNEFRGLFLGGHIACKSKVKL